MEPNDVVGGCSPANAFLAKLRESSPITLEQEARAMPAENPRRIHLLHAAAEHFSAWACHEVLAHWERSQETGATDIVAYWRSICEWLPPTRTDSIAMDFVACWEQEWRHKDPQAIATYYAMCYVHPLACVRVARLYKDPAVTAITTYLDKASNSMLHSSILEHRLAGWQRYQGAMTKHVVALRCLSMTFSCSDYHPSHIFFFTALACIACALGCTEGVTVVSEETKAPCQPLTDLLCLASRQSFHAAMYLREMRARGHPVPQRVLDSDAARDLVAQEGWTQLGCWPWSSARANSPFADAVGREHLQTVMRAVPSLRPEHVIFEAHFPFYRLDMSAKPLPSSVVAALPSRSLATNSLAPVITARADASIAASSVTAAVAYNNVDLPSAPYANTGVEQYANVDLAAADAAPPLMHSICSSITPLAREPGNLPAFALPPAGICATQSTVLDFANTPPTPVSERGNEVIVWCIVLTTAHRFPHPTAFSRITPATKRCSVCTSLIQAGTAWVCDIHEVIICGAQACAYAKKHRLAAEWKPARELPKYFPISRDDQDACIAAKLARAIPDLAGRIVLQEVYRAVSRLGYRASITWLSPEDAYEPVMRYGDIVRVLSPCCRVIKCVQQAWHECNWEVTPISCPPCATRRVLDENFALKMPHFLKAMQRIYFTQPAPWLPYAFECACFMMQMEQSLNLPEMRPSDWGNLCAWFGPAGSAAFWLRIAWLASQRWFFGVVKTERAVELATSMGQREGAWLLRFSTSEKGGLAFTVREAAGKVMHYRVSRDWSKRAEGEYVLRVNRDLELRYSELGALLAGASEALKLIEPVGALTVGEEAIKACASKLYTPTALLTSREAFRQYLSLGFT